MLFCLIAHLLVTLRRIRYWFSMSLMKFILLAIQSGCFQNLHYFLLLITGCILSSPLCLQREILIQFMVAFHSKDLFLAVISYEE